MKLPNPFLSCYTFHTIPCLQYHAICNVYTIIYYFITLQNMDEAVIFEPALFPIQPDDLSVRVSYRVPAMAKSHLKESSQIAVVVDTPYNVRDVRSIILSNR